MIRNLKKNIQMPVMSIAPRSAVMPVFAPVCECTRPPIRVWKSYLFVFSKMEYSIL